MTHEFRQVDVFGATAMEGNPVAVVLGADDLSDEQMRRFSVWSNLSECTFLLEPTQHGADYRVRIFNLSTELPFAGHPTLGSARAWLDAGGVPARADALVQECGAGLVPIRRDQEMLAFAAPALQRSGPVDPATLAAALDVLGVAEEDVVDAAWIDNGPGWLGVLLADAESVLALRPDSSAHPQRWTIGVAAPAPEGASVQWEVRGFFSEEHQAIREDPVTGSLNASLAQWLIATGRAPSAYRAAQGTAMGRAGRIQLSSEGPDVWVGGRTDVVVRGSVEI